MALVSWAPQWAPHVVGTHPAVERDPDTGQPEPVVVKMRCGRCNAYFQTTCNSGATRQHITRFAIQHAHKDPFGR
jgi:hypothetical protein